MVAVAYRAVCRWVTWLTWRRWWSVLLRRLLHAVAAVRHSWTRTVRWWWTDRHYHRRATPPAPHSRSVSYHHYQSVSPPQPTSRCIMISACLSVCASCAIRSACCRFVLVLMRNRCIITHWLSLQLETKLSRIHAISCCHNLWSSGKWAMNVLMIAWLVCQTVPAGWWSLSRIASIVFLTACALFLLSLFICIFLYCFVCQYQSSDWLWRPLPKWPILCRVGC